MILSKFYKCKPRFTLVELIIVVVVGILLVVGPLSIWRYIPMKRRPIPDTKIQFEWEPDVILGKIAAAKPYSYDEYKIIAYVKTDVWYAHPWKGAFTLINEDGSWELESVDRTPSPTQIGTFLVEKDYVPPLLVYSLEDLKAISYSVISVPSIMKE